MKLDNLKKSAKATANKPAKERDYIAIVARDGLVGVWTGSKDDSVYECFDKTEIGALHCLKVALENLVPTNDTLVDKQIAIYILDCIYAIGSVPGDMIRDERFFEYKELVQEIEQLMFERRYNFLLARSKDSNATIVKEGWDWLKNIAKDAIKSGTGVTQTNATNSSTEAAIQALTAQMVAAAAKGDMDTVRDLTAAIGALNGNTTIDVQELEKENIEDPMQAEIE